MFLSSNVFQWLVLSDNKQNSTHDKASKGWKGVQRYKRSDGRIKINNGPW